MNRLWRAEGCPDPENGEIHIECKMQGHCSPARLGGWPLAVARKCTKIAYWKILKIINNYWPAAGIGRQRPDPAKNAKTAKKCIGKYGNIEILKRPRNQ